jgi:receptor expression-enhancing protein 5/6
MQSKAQQGISSAQATAVDAAGKIAAHPAVQQARDRFREYMAQLDKELSRYPLLNHLEQRTNVPKAYGAVIASITFLCLIFINTLALPVSNLVGWAFPAYLSFRAIESPGHDDDIQWLTYWVVFGFFTFLESIALRVVLYYFPYYFPVKTAFVLWLQLPGTKGAQTFYHSVFRPVLTNIRGKRAAYNPNATSQYPTTTVPDHEKVL